jgi:phosphate transport system substrate-binding protein
MRSHSFFPRGLGAVVLAVMALAAAACGGGQSTSGTEAPVVQINGAGATFPYPIYSKWFSEYNTLHPNIRINYQSIGSGGGVRQLQNQTVFSGASDYPMTDEQLAGSAGAIVHLPTVVGSVVPVYNLPGVTAELRFTGPILADIFLGKITKWNDPALVAVNPGVSLPDRAITVVHRSDGSGTTFVWVDYLSKVSSEWREKVGAATSVNWPIGLGGKGNEGVAGLVKLTEGALGYVEPVYATQNQLPFGAVQNASGAFVKSSIASVTAVADGAAATIPADFRVSITNAPGAESYPIASFTWILMYEASQDPQQAAAMVEFMRWALTDGQKFAAELGYSPLPASIVERELQALSRIKVQ